VTNVSWGDIKVAAARETIGSRGQCRNESHRFDVREELRIRRFAFIDKNVLQEEAAPEGFSGA
jgi:hypothetical protein